MEDTSKFNESKLDDLTVDSRDNRCKDSTKST